MDLPASKTLYPLRKRLHFRSEYNAWSSLVGYHCHDFSPLKGNYLPSHLYTNEKNVKDRTSLAYFCVHQRDLETLSTSPQAKNNKFLGFIQKAIRPIKF